jgi:hypothetical protein
LETLYEWAVVFLVMAGRPGTNADARGRLVDGPDHESPTRHFGNPKVPSDQVARRVRRNDRAGPAKA